MGFTGWRTSIMGGVRENARKGNKLAVRGLARSLSSIYLVDGRRAVPWGKTNLPLGLDTARAHFLVIYISTGLIPSSSFRVSSLRGGWKQKPDLLMRGTQLPSTPFFGIRDRERRQNTQTPFNFHLGMYNA
jgi:hypothetical protein